MAVPTASPSIDQIIAGWQAMFPGAPIPQGMQQAKDLGANYGAGSAYSTIQSPSGNPISLSQLALAGVPAAAAAPANTATPAIQGAPAGSYLSLTGTNPAGDGTGTAGTAGTATGGSMAAQNAFGISQVGSGPGYTILNNANNGQNIAVDSSGNYFAIDPATGNHTPVTYQQAQAAGFIPQSTAPQPETAALGQMAQIDPQSEALRQGLAQSYLTSATAAPVAPTTTATTGAPSAADVQSYLSLYGQIDPTGLAARQQLGSDLAAQEALGTQLDPATQRQLEQQTRISQSARGNVYGTPQLVQEAMTTGQAGLALQQQRQQALQSYLSSGQTVGDIANTLYQQGAARNLATQGQAFSQQQAGWQQQQQQLQAALGYLGSGQTPYQAGAAYVNQANQAAASAAQGGAAYNQQGPSSYYTGQGTASFPQYGVDTSQTAANWYNLMNAYNQPQGSSSQNKGGSAAAGALGGAASGAMTGMAAGPYGALAGAAIGAVGGAAKGYFS